MWPFGKKSPSLRASGLLQGSTDWHSHILPGVDDGFQDMEESLKALATLEELGVKDLWLTPHIMEDYPNATDDLKKQFEQLKEVYKGKMKLHLASENMLDSLFEERLADNDFLPIGESGGHLLVETSYYNPPMNLYELLEEIKRKGYYPLLAHPERYRYMDTSDYLRLKDMGVLFQANYLSLVGAYGATAQKKLEWLLEKGMVDLIGSDLHRNAVLDSMIEASPRSKKHLEAMRMAALNAL